MHRHSPLVLVLLVVLLGGLLVQPLGAGVVAGEPKGSDSSGGGLSAGRPGDTGVSGLVVELSDSTAVVAPQSVGYTYVDIKHSKLLRSDGSCVVHLASRVRNDSSEPMAMRGWAFYYGRDNYLDAFAEDELGMLDADIKQAYSSTWGQWGLEIRVPFREPLLPGEEYWFAVGLVINDHHTVTDSEIRASWMVHSSAVVTDYVQEVSWPHSHLGVVATPEPDLLESSYARWERRAFTGEWQFTLDIAVTLGDQMAVVPLSQGIPPYDGNDPHWESYDYGLYTGKPIWYWGCKLTCGAMAMNYFAGIMGNPHRTDPGKLNDWLAEIPSGKTEPRGYGPGNTTGEGQTYYSMVKTSMFDDASKELFAAPQPLIKKLHCDESVEEVSDLLDGLENGWLGILWVPFGDGHYVLVTGYTTQDGELTAVINDPWEDFGTTTLRSRNWNDNLGPVCWYAKGDSLTRMNQIRLYAQCPIELVLTDSAGRRVGYDPRSDQQYREIPGGVYYVQHGPGQPTGESEGTKTLEVNCFQREQFVVEVISTGTGPYTIWYEGDLFGGDTANGRVTGIVQPGQVDTISLPFDPNVGFQLCTVALPQVLARRLSTDVGGLVQAESATLTPPFAVGSASDASGGHYVYTATGHSGSATLSVTVPASGSYYLYARGKGNAFTENSFWVSVDGGERVWYEIPYNGYYGEWGWSEIEPDASSDCWTLAAGSHEIVFSGREPNAFLDCIVLTDDAGYVPSD